MEIQRPRGSAANGIIPIGGIIMWSGTVATIPTNWQLCDGTNGTPDLRDKFIVGAKQDDAGVAKTNVTGSLTQSGGSVAYTPAGTNSAPTFTGSALSSHTHSVTSNVTVADHAAHTHSYTDVPNHVHVQNAPTSASGGAILYALDTNASGSTSAGISTANNTGGVASGTTGNPSAVLSHTPTNNAVTSGNESATMTPAGTVSAPTFMGTAATIVPPYFALAFIQRLS